MNSTPLPAPELAVALDALANAAAAEFQLRQARARRMVRDGTLSETAATRALRPWLAIACRAGADLPELEDGLAELSVTSLDGTAWLTPGQLRARLADDICPARIWRADLIAARDAGLSAADTNPAAADRARALVAIAAALAPNIPIKPAQGTPA